MTPRRSEWSGIRCWRECVTWAGRNLYVVPAAIRILALAAIAFLGLFATNLAFHVLCKPTEMFAFVSNEFNKAPAETWRQYGRLFREYSALAQVEGAGNPLARTYWRWQLSWNPLALYQPASSGVGMFQMTDAAFAEARQFCIRNHIVSQDDCRSGWLYIRVLPSHAIELAAVYLDRNLERIFAGRPTAKPSAEHKRELASMAHLCGVGAAKSFAQRGFRLVAGERCGDHDVANYLARVKAMEREFLRLAASQ
jgi:hypothetical protein